MCNTCTEWISSRSMQKSRWRRSRLRIHGLNRRKRSSNEEEEEMDMDMDIGLKNLKLYMENMSILEWNEKLRKKAMILHQENLALMSQLQNKVSISTT